MTEARQESIMRKGKDKVNLYHSYEFITSSWKQEEFPDYIKYTNPHNSGVNIAIGKKAKIGNGILIMPGTIIYNAHIGDSCIISSNVIIEDDVKVNDYVRIGANVHLGEKVEIGNNVSIENDVSIGENTTVISNLKIPYGMIIEPDLVVVRNPMFLALISG